MGINKNCKAGYQILTEKYNAKIEQGRRRYYKTEPYFTDRASQTLDATVETIHSVQIDLHPEHAEVFLQMIEEWHDNTSSFYVGSPSNPNNPYSPKLTPLEIFYNTKVSEMSRNEALDKKLREQNPTLQKMWEKYETMKALVNER
jgi:hypothetical protein|tara:strand:- start:7224 stop:7658 length:435 start_codon:yes stop_codon:yes gene_type:complete